VIIDVHTHVVPENFPRYAGKNSATAWPSMGCCDQPHHRAVLIKGKTFREVSHHCWDVTQRLLDMQAEGVSRQVLSPMPELLSYWFDVDDAVRMSEHINACIAKMMSSSPESFYGLGMVPLQDPERAVKLMSRLREDYGLVGIEVGTNINGRPIGDPFFEPIFAAAVQYDLSIFIHPLHPAGVERIVGPPAMSALVAFPNETAFAAASLVSGGMLTKYPELRVGLSHGGGSFALMLPRMMQGWRTMGNHLFTESPIDIAKRLYYDTLVYDNEALEYLIKSFGIKQLMLGSDYPFVIREESPGERIQSLKLTESEKVLLLSKNALHFLGFAN